MTSIPSIGPHRPAQFLTIQYIRGAAALAVVVFHVLAFKLAPPGWTWLHVGQRGVDVFFVISGFIMFTAAREERFGEFWRRRLLRLVPLYWLGTAAMFALMIWEKGTHPSGSDTLASLLFIPRYSDASPGHINPILYVGWTLQYEMFFYLLFSIGLIARRPVMAPVALLAGCVLLGRVWSPHNALVVTCTSPLLIEFGAGLLLGKVAASRSLAGGRWLLWPGILLLGVPALPGWGIGVAATLVVAGAVGFDQRGSMRALAWPKLLGDGSYALYLVHPLVISLIGVSLARAGVVINGAGLVWAAVVVAATALIAGLSANYWVERPLLRLGNRWWPARRIRFDLIAPARHPADPRGGRVPAESALARGPIAGYGARHDDPAHPDRRRVRLWRRRGDTG
ncbi:acyltransferase family protein [Sphingomonas sp.]|uniref:acyltransferase family protein n=1 Tax=Sphingomonas sp. TaxID=28214 RepID=UPI003CC59E46